MHDIGANKPYREKAWRELHQNSTSCIEQILEESPHETAAVPPLTYYL